MNHPALGLRVPGVKWCWAILRADGFYLGIIVQSGLGVLPELALFSGESEGQRQPNQAVPG